jgi:hypothetical protein
MADENKKKQPEEPSLPEKVIAIHEALRVEKLPHALGGALALAYYAEPRVTIDIDLNVFVAADRWRDVVGALVPLGVEADDLDSEALLRDGQCRLWWNDNPVDLFFAYDEVHEEMRKEARRLPFADETLPFLAPEHLAVCKAMFDRPKDWIDIEQMLLAEEEIDIARVEGWLQRMVGEEDLRLQRLRELTASLDKA